MLCKHCVFLPWSVWTWLRREAAHKDWGMWMGKGRKEKFCSGWPACLFTSWGKPHGRASLGKYFLIVTFQGSFSFFFFFGFCAYRKWEGKKKIFIPLWSPSCNMVLNTTLQADFSVKLQGNDSTTSISGQLCNSNILLKSSPPLGMEGFQYF